MRRRRKKGCARKMNAPSRRRQLNFVAEQWKGKCYGEAATKPETYACYATKLCRASTIEIFNVTRDSYRHNRRKDGRGERTGSLCDFTQSFHNNVYHSESFVLLRRTRVSLRPNNFLCNFETHLEHSAFKGSVSQPVLVEFFIPPDDGPLWSSKFFPTAFE